MLQELITYSQENKRVCLQPQLWNKLHARLSKHAKEKVIAPLILAAWWDASNLQKMLRFQEHLELAEQLGKLNEINAWLRSLPESDWHHLND